MTQIILEINAAEGGAHSKLLVDNMLKTYIKVAERECL